ncbi:hypothetical protein SAMN05192589_107120 [Paracidovorax valerianellae]|uniref:Uncharacterized protein n=1 Tax=Paracidovorax valerianellae TaxID=187868 RepID=A0A1G6VTI0_9BURK|nr:hypothetical protein [Paracidovorax valerianellae]SDD56297.1 hypothetical protein SAMN05192589_107120 [Paracidovorax valerianellae]
MGDAIRELSVIIERESADEYRALLLRDAFAAGCFLHLQGETLAGKKLCAAVLKALGGSEDRGTLFSDILGSLTGNESRYATSIRAHHEFNELFDQHRD